METENNIGTASYSPDDNKIRIYPHSRLCKEDYDRVKAAGFGWAPKQQLFVAPMWTPSREDLAIELCGELGDEDTSLVDRAEQRAERFDGYSARRASDSDAAHKTVAGIADGIPFGQPILVGHHSERHARKDAERIENAMSKAVRMWDQSRYWADRAAGALRAAKHKELPTVRARRIKTIEAAKRKEERYAKQYATVAKFWNGELQMLNKATGERKPCEVNRENALWFTGNFENHMSFEFPLVKYPRILPASQYEGRMDLWSALGSDKGPEYAVITVEQAKSLALGVCARVAVSAGRWIAHYGNRLAYEKAMLEEQGASDLLKPKPRREQLPICNYRSASICIENIYHLGQFDEYPQIEMTSAEYAKIYRDYKGTHEVDHSHRVRTCIKNHARCCVFLTDSKVHTRPEPQAKPEPVLPPLKPVAQWTPRPKNEAVEAMRDSLKTGVKVVVAPQLFPTPLDVAVNMVQLADIQQGDSVLEPSAGTGSLLEAYFIQHGNGFGRVTAVEINKELHTALNKRYFITNSILCADFLQCNGDLGKFDRILMNPPFERGSDIRHIKHAMTFLRPGGRLVAICANGPRQQEELQPLCDSWEPLPDDTFKEQGTGVRTVLLTINA